VTIASASLTGLPPNHLEWDLPLDFAKHTTCPHYYRFGQDGESEAEFTQRCVQDLKDLIEHEGPDTIAAFIGEPIMGAGGVLVPPEGYWPKVAEICKKYDVLLICDEVINGFCRTGNMWGSETVGVKPDIMTVAKQLSAAYLPIGATLISEEIFDVIAEHSPKHGVFGIGMTYGGHPVCAAVALETLKIYEEERILDHVRDVSPVFMQRLAEAGEHPLVGQARGVGLIGAMELVADKETREQYPASAKAAPTVYAKTADHGAFGRALPGDAMGFCPPLIITEAEINEMFDAVMKGLGDTEKVLKAA